MALLQNCSCFVHVRSVKLLPDKSNHSGLLWLLKMFSEHSSLTFFYNFTFILVYWIKSVDDISKKKAFVCGNDTVLSLSPQFTVHKSERWQYHSLMTQKCRCYMLEQVLLYWAIYTCRYCILIPVSDSIPVCNHKNRNNNLLTILCLKFISLQLDQFLGRI